MEVLSLHASRRRRRNAPRPRRKSSPLLLLLFVGAALTAGAWVYLQPPGPDAARAEAPAGSTIRIASWNLRKFSDRDAPDLATIARIVRDSSFDLVCIQEVQRQGQAVERLRRQLNEPWRHAVSDRTGNNERYGILYRADRIELTDGPRLHSGPHARVFDRVPMIASFRAGSFDFTVVAVHLWYGEKANNPRRAGEAQALATIARELAAAGPERDILVLGDFNEMRAGGNLHRFTSMGWALLNAEPTNLSSTEVYDNLLIDRQFTREWTGRTGVVRFDESMFGDDDAARASVSDHRPVWADFRVDWADDD